MTSSTIREPWIGRTRNALLAVGVLATLVFSAVALLDDPDAPPVIAERAVAATTTTTSTTTTTTVPPGPNHEIKPLTHLAAPRGVITAYDGPGGNPIGEVGLWYGYEMTMPVVEESTDGQWLRIMLPERPNESTAWVQAAEVDRSTSPWHMVVELDETTLYVYKDGQLQFTTALGIGRDNTRTPTGSYFLAVIEDLSGTAYGSPVLNLSAHSEDIQSWQGSGDAITAFHGPFGAQSLLRNGGGKVSNGCLRMLPEDQAKLAPITLGTPVDIYR